MKIYLIVCPFVFLAGIVDSIAGGGGIITLPAYLIAGLNPHLAIGTNKMSSSMGASLTIFRYGKKGYVPWKLAFFCLAFALAGATCGARLSLLIDENILKIIMLFLLPATAFLVLKKKIMDDSEQIRPITAKTYAYCCIIAFFISAYDGFYGPGTGTFLLLLFSSVAHLDLKRANGLAKFVNFLSNIGALFVFIMNGQSNIRLGLIAGLFSMAGSYIGTTLFSSKGIKVVKPVMIGVLVILFIKVITELAGISFIS